MAPKKLAAFALTRPLALAVGMLLSVADPATAVDPFRIGTGTCSGCNICLQMGSTSSTPLHESDSCGPPGGCTTTGPGPNRFADLISYRGFLQVVTQTIDIQGCAPTLFGFARWKGGSGTSDDSNVFFTGPQGQSSVLCRVHYVYSSATTGFTGVEFTARLHDTWANAMNLPTNVTNMDLVSPFIQVDLNSWQTCEGMIQSNISNNGNGGSGTTCCLLHFPLNSPVFDLPPGYTANSPTLGIVNNIWHGIDYQGDWDATTGSVSCFNSMALLHSVTGDSIAQNTSASIINMGNLGSVGGSVTVSGNTSASNIDMGSLTSVGGDANVSNNTSASDIDMGSLTSVNGGTNVNGNTSASDIDMGSLTSVGGDTNVTGNGGGSPLADGAPISIKLASLTTVDGNLNISGNSRDTTVTLGPLSMVTGDLTLETKTPPDGSIDLSTAAVAGNINIKAKEADAVHVRTPPPGKITDVALSRSESSIAANLPTDTFSGNEIFSIDHIDSATLPPQGGLDAEGQPIRIDPVEGYHVDVANDPPLQQDATLTLEVNVDGLSPTERTNFLNALAANRVMLASRGNGARNQYQAFETCDARTQPTPGGCAKMELFDQNHNPLPPQTSNPAFVRFTCKTNHFSSFAVAIKIRPGDITGNGFVNVDDLLSVINAWGRCPPPSPGGCPADIAPPPNGNGFINVDDLLMVINNWG